MSDRRIWGVSWLLAIVALAGAPEARAAVSDLVANQEALSDRPAGRTVGRGMLDGIVPTQRLVTITFMEMLLGPSVRNLDGHLTTQPTPPPVPGAPVSASPRGRKRGVVASSTTAATVPAAPTPATEPGSSLRHVLTVSFHVTDKVGVSPVLNFSQKFYGNDPGKVKLGDPQLRLALSDVVRADLDGGHAFRSALWFTGSFPTSDLSQRMHSAGSLTVSVVPRLHLAHSDFSFSGTASGKSTLIHKNGGDEVLSPLRFFGALQGNYRVSRVFTGWLNLSTSRTAGPEISLGDDSEGDAARTNAKNGKFGLMPGMSIRATEAISLSPRLDWVIGQPLETTTVALSANLQMI